MRDFNKFNSISAPVDWKRLSNGVILEMHTQLNLTRVRFETFRGKLRGAFQKQRDLSTEEDISKALERGNYVYKEIEALYYLKKYLNRYLRCHQSARSLGYTDTGV